VLRAAWCQALRPEHEQTQCSPAALSILLSRTAPIVGARRRGASTARCVGATPTGGYSRPRLPPPPPSCWASPRAVGGLRSRGRRATPATPWASRVRTRSLNPQINRYTRVSGTRHARRPHSPTPARPFGRSDAIGSVASCTSMCRSHDVTTFSAPTRTPPRSRCNKPAAATRPTWRSRARVCAGRMR
jgi:hypothetical protein